VEADAAIDAHQRVSTKNRRNKIFAGELANFKSFARRHWYITMWLIIVVGGPILGIAMAPPEFWEGVW